MFTKQMNVLGPVLLDLKGKKKKTNVWNLPFLWFTKQLNDFCMSESGQTLFHVGCDLFNTQCEFVGR